MCRNTGRQQRTLDPGKLRVLRRERKEREELIVDNARKLLEPLPCKGPPPAPLPVCRRWRHRPGLTHPRPGREPEEALRYVRQRSGRTIAGSVAIGKRASSPC